MKFIVIILFCFGTSISIAQESLIEKRYPNSLQKKIHTFRISTNLVRPLMEFNGYPGSDGWAISYRFLSSSRDVSIEPEYQLSNQFSIAVPFYFGLTRMDTETFSPTLYTSWSFIDSTSMPRLDYIQTNYKRRLDLIAQIGIQGKWFPWGHEIKEKAHIYPFLSAGLTIALYDIYSVDFGQTWDSNSIAETGEYDYLGGENIPFLAVRSHKTGVFRGEFLTGIELMFGKHLGLIYSLGFSTKRIYFQEATDRVYSRIEGQEFTLTEEFGFPGVDNLSMEPKRFLINRLQLTYAFGLKTK
jgi:hypothetical protein